MRTPIPKKDLIRFQVLAMRRIWGDRFKVFKMRNDEVIWRGCLQATAIGEEYKVEIRYRKGKSPDIYVHSPALKSRGNNEPIPHIYPGNSLCLYLPRNSEWTDDMAIAETTVPWASLWLYHYEVWHITGEWLGGGVHPGEHPKQQVEVKG